MARTPPSSRIEVGAIMGPRELVSTAGEKVAVPDPELLVHLAFRRFAGCPICHLATRALAERHDEVLAAGLREVVLFHSTKEALLKQDDVEGALPFPVIGDPDKEIYREFGVESSLVSILSPKILLPDLRGMRSKRKALHLNLAGGPLGLPAEFLIAPGGRVVAAHYGKHAYDQWSVDDLLELATVRHSG